LSRSCWYDDTHPSLTMDYRRARSARRVFSVYGV
jgi:hypothetical protein